MKSLFRLTILCLLLGGWGLAAASVYVIRTAGGNWPIVLLPRAQMAQSVRDFEETYVDTRGWTMKDVAEHPAVVARIIQADDAAYLRHVANRASRQSLVAQLANVLQQTDEAAQLSDAVMPLALQASPAAVRLAKATASRSRAHQ